MKQMRASSSARFDDDRAKAGVGDFVDLFLPN